MADPKPIIISRPLGGFSDDYGTSSHAVEGPDGSYSTSNGIQMFRDGFLGHISPAALIDGYITDTTPYINSLPRGFVVDPTSSNPDGYSILGGAAGTAPKVIKMNCNTFVTSAQNTFSSSPHSTHNWSGATTSGYYGEDIIIYRHKVGGNYTNSLFYSWNDNTDGDIGRYDLASTWTNEWMSTVPTGAAVLTGLVPHYMTVGPDLVLYITNGQYLASYDGTSSASNGTFNAQALNLGAGWIASSIKTWQKYIVIAASKSSPGKAFVDLAYAGESRIFFWDGFSPDPNFVYDVNDGYLAALHVRDTVYAFSRGRNYTGKIWAFDGAKFVMLHNSEQYVAKVGGNPNQNQVTYYMDCLTYATKDVSGINAYGPLSDKNRGLHIAMYLNDGTNNSSERGFLTNVDQENLYAGVKYDTTYTIAKGTMNGNYLENADFRSLLISIPHKSTISKITVYFSQFSADSSLLVSLFKDYTTSSPGGTGDQLNTTISTSTYPTITTDMSAVIIKNIPNVSSFYLNLRFNHTDSTKVAAVVRAVVVEYKPSDKP